MFAEKLNSLRLYIHPSIHYLIAVEDYICFSFWFKSQRVVELLQEVFCIAFQKLHSNCIQVMAPAQHETLQSSTLGSRKVFYKVMMTCRDCQRKICPLWTTTKKMYIEVSCKPTYTEMLKPFFFLEITMSSGNSFHYFPWTASIEKSYSIICY